MLDMGVEEQAQVDTSLIVPGPKKDRTKQYCIAYQQLNDVKFETCTTYCKYTNGSTHWELPRRFRHSMQIAE